MRCAVRTAGRRDATRAALALAPILALALALAGTAVVAAAQDAATPPATPVTTVQQIDRVADAAVHLVARAVPDAGGSTLWLLPFLTDTDQPTRLGHRLRSAVHLRLLRRYRQTAVAAADVALPTARAHGAAPAASAPAAPASATTGNSLTAEIQPFRDTIRIVLKVLRGGRLEVGDWIDLDASAELRDLLDGAADQSPPAGKAAVGSAAGTFDPQRERPAATGEEDPFEPDDVAGAEVMVDLAAATRFTRTLTPGDRDRFVFHLAQPAAVVLETATELDTQLLLYVEGDRVPFSVNDDRAGGGGSRLALELVAGWYVAEVVGFSDTATGTYQFLISVGDGNADALPAASALGPVPEATTERPPEEPEPAPRAPLPPAIAVGATQERYTAGGEDWLELWVPSPGFYLLEARSFGAPIELSLHHDPGQPELLAAATGFSPAIRSLALFVGLGSAHARIGTTGGGEVVYSLALSQLDLPRRFSDGAPLTLQMTVGVAFHTLRVFRPGSYVLAADGTYGAVAARVFSVPDLSPQPGRAHPAGVAVREYDLPSGDYLIELVSAEPNDRARVCWTASGTAAQCLD